MISAELNGMLIDRLPDLREKYLSEVEWQDGDDTGSHIVYGDVLRPYLRECIVQGNEPEYRKILDFLEDLLRLNDGYAEEVVCLSVLESLAYLFCEREYLLPILGGNCRKALSGFLSN